MQTIQIGETKRRILKQLKDRATTLAGLREVLKINKTAIRAHLEGLEKIAAVESCFKQEGRGRPKKFFKLTDRGMDFFPTRYELFLAMLLKTIVDTEGFANAKKLVSSLANTIGEQLVKPLAEAKPSIDRTGRVDLAVKAMDDMGFESVKEQQEGNLAIVSRNCIVYRTAVENHDLICHAFHDKLIERILPGARVELKECIAEAAPFCRHALHFP